MMYIGSKTRRAAHFVYERHVNHEPNIHVDHDLKNIHVNHELNMMDIGSRTRRAAHHIAHTQNRFVPNFTYTSMSHGKKKMKKVSRHRERHAARLNAHIHQWSRIRMYMCESRWFAVSELQRCKHTYINILIYKIYIQICCACTSRALKKSNLKRVSQCSKQRAARQNAPLFSDPCITHPWTHICCGCHCFSILARMTWPKNKVPAHTHTHVPDWSASRVLAQSSQCVADSWLSRLPTQMLQWDAVLQPIPVGVTFSKSSFQAQSPNVSFHWNVAKDTFELWALKQHSKRSPEMG